MPTSRCLRSGCWPSASHRPSRRTESALVGRTWELNTITAILDEAIGGAGCVVTVVGPPGIGKSRLIRESAAIAAGRGVPVVTTYCESHATDIPFHVVARLARERDGDRRSGRRRGAHAIFVSNFTGRRPRGPRCCSTTCWASATAQSGLPEIAPDARRRRLTALINSASLARAEPAVYVIEDAHWIDEASESLLADFLAVVPQIPALDADHLSARVPRPPESDAGAQTIALRPLSDAQAAARQHELLGDRSTAR